MKDPDTEAFEFYDDPAHREPAVGQPRRRARRPLTRHVPVRFPAETIEAVQSQAESDGMTVSSWIRRAVDDALGQRGRASSSGDTTSDDPVAVVEHLRTVVNQLAATLERRPARPARGPRR
jgi:hypothetical protein